MYVPLSKSIHWGPFPHRCYAKNSSPLKALSIYCVGKIKMEGEGQEFETEGSDRCYCTFRVMKQKYETQHGLDMYIELIHTFMVSIGPLTFIGFLNSYLDHTNFMCLNGQLEPEPISP